MLDRKIPAFINWGVRTQRLARTLYSNTKAGLKRRGCWREYGRYCVLRGRSTKINDEDKITHSPLGINEWSVTLCRMQISDAYCRPYAMIVIIFLINNSDVTIV